MPVVTSSEVKVTEVPVKEEEDASPVESDRKGEDFPYEIRKNDLYGRYVVATRDLQPGDLILKEKAYVYGPKQNSTPVCLGCTRLIEDDEIRCSRCSYPMCAQECGDSPLHLIECEVLAAGGQAARPVIADFTKPAAYLDAVTTVRVLKLRESSPKQWERVMQMDCSPQQWPGSEVGATFQHNVVNFLRTVCKVDADEKLLHKIGGLLITNAFEARARGFGSHVRCVFPEAALLAHSCMPNIHHTIDEEFNIYLRAATHIKKGETLFTSYTHCLTGTLTRREVLKYSKFFDCGCHRCGDPSEGDTFFSALKCPICGKGNILPKDSLDAASEWSCSGCSHEVHPDNVRRMNKMLLHELDQMDGNDFIDHEMFIRKYVNLLHPGNYLIFDAKHRLSQMYGRTPEYPLERLTEIHLRRKIELCREVLKVALKNAPGIARLTGLTYYELHAPLVVLAQRMYNKDAISRTQMQALLDEAAESLHSATRMLQYEPANSLEGKIHSAALKNLVELEELRQRTESLPENGRGHLTAESIEELCGSFNAILDFMEDYQFRC